MAKVTKDKYANVAFGGVVQTALDTLTFSPIQLAVGIFQGIALCLHRVLYYPTIGVLRELVAATDALEMAMCTSNRVDALYDVAEPAIIDVKTIVCGGIPTEPYVVPYISDLTTLPGGGRIIAANPLYFGVNTQGFTAVAHVIVQLDFTFVELTDADYIELIQSQLAANI